MNIVMLGPQGSGKGTQADLVAAKYEMAHLSTGALLREEIAKGTPVGKAAQKTINSGKLIDDDVTNSLVEMRIISYDKENIILDGYPRTMFQAEYIAHSMRIDLVLEITLPEEESVRRISARRNCPKCSSQYNLIYVKPKNENRCDRCNVALQQREDDTPDAVRKRLAEYHKNTQPLRRFFEKESLYYAIDGNKPIPDVFSDVTRTIDANLTAISSRGKDNALIKFFKKLS